MDFRFYLVQRLTALLMAPLVITHIVVMIIAIQGGLSAEEILSRTSGSVVWALFYGSFVLLAALHGAIGLGVILSERIKLTQTVLFGFVGAVFLLLLLLGLKAVHAVTAL